MLVSMFAQVDPDMKAGLWMICKACKERNYLEAYDIYMRLAVGVYASPPKVSFDFRACAAALHYI